MVALIISVGGAEEPIAKALTTHKPEFVCFVCSERSVEQIGLIKQLLPPDKWTFQDKKLLISDPNSLEECFNVALKSGEVVESRGFEKDQVIVDFTGGTKVMSSGLVLATVSRGYRFSYVGGAARNKDGLGTVVTGCELVHESRSPWDVIALHDQRKLEWCFNAYQYETCLALLRDIKARSGISPSIRILMEALEPLVMAYDRWDRFDHSKAVLDGLKQAQEKLQIYTNLEKAYSLDGFVQQIAANREFYEKFMEDAHGFAQGRLCDHHVYDLVGNATRRAEENKYDDGVARLYRALEMFAQARLGSRRPPIDTANVRVDLIPESIRGEFVRRYSDQKGVVKVPLSASFMLLKELGEETADLYFAREEQLRDVLAARNASILAHGTTVLTREKFERFKNLVCGLLPSEVYPRFPRLTLTGGTVEAESGKAAGTLERPLVR